MFKGKQYAVALAVVVFAIGCNRENDRPMTPASGSTNEMSPSSPGASDYQSPGRDSMGMETSGTDSGVVGSDSSTTGSGTGTGGSGNTGYDSTSPGSGTTGSGTTDSDSSTTGSGSGTTGSGTTR